MVRTTFLDKTLLAITHVAEQSFFSEQYASRRGFLQGLDIRYQIVSFLFILIVISVLHRPESLLLLYGAGLVLAAASRIPVCFLMKRVWLFVPLFTALIVLPALLNIVTPGDPVAVLYRFSRPRTWGPYTLPAEISITRQGIQGGVVLVLRVAASVSFAVLFTLTRRWAEIFSGFRALGVPRAFVMTLSMTERYIFVFLRLIQDMYRARKSRTIRVLSMAAERSWTASRVGVTFRKSLEMSDDVYKAMLARGFSGEFRSVSRFRSGIRDYLWLGLVAAAGALLLLYERGMIR